MSEPLAGVLIGALAFATYDEELNTWWRQHKELIGRLTEADRARLVAAGKAARARISTPKNGAPSLVIQVTR